METACDYFVRTENTVRMLLKENQVCKDKVRLIQESITLSDVTLDLTNANLKFCDWWAKNKNEEEIISEAHQKYAVEAFSSSLLAGTVLQIAARAIELYSENTTVPDDWRKIGRKNFPVPKFFIGRTVHTVPVGLVIYAGRDHYLKTYSGRVIEAINQEVFVRLGDLSGQLGFQDLVERNRGF